MTRPITRAARSFMSTVLQAEFGALEHRDDAGLGGDVVTDGDLATAAWYRVFWPVSPSRPLRLPPSGCG